MKRFRSFFYLIIASTLLFYGLPRFQLTGLNSISEGFALIWTFFALLVIGSHLFDILGATKEEPYQMKSTKQREKVRVYNS